MFSHPAHEHDAIARCTQEAKRLTSLTATHHDTLLAHPDTAPLLPHVLTLSAALLAAGDTLAQAQAEFELAVGREGRGTHWNTRATTDLERIIWHAQARIAESFGPEMLRLYGLEESPPLGERTLATYAHNAVTLLRASEASLPGHFGDSIDTEQIAQAIEQPLWALGDYLATLDEASDLFKGAMATREAASTHWIRLWRGVSTLLESLFVLADRSDVAAKICPRLPVLHPELDTEHLG